MARIAGAMEASTRQVLFNFILHRVRNISNFIRGNFFPSQLLDCHISAWFHIYHFSSTLKSVTFWNILNSFLLNFKSLHLSLLQIFRALKNSGKWILNFIGKYWISPSHFRWWRSADAAQPQHPDGRAQLVPPGQHRAGVSQPSHYIGAAHKIRAR